MLNPMKLGAAGSPLSISQEAANQAYASRAKVSYDDDGPRFEGDTGWLITTPVPIDNIVAKRFFRRGQCRVYDENLARFFVDELHYTSEPALAPPPPAKAVRRRGKAEPDARSVSRPRLAREDENLPPLPTTAKRTSR